METRQLVLIDKDEDERTEWRLDERTREIGLKGVAEARAALRAALARDHGGSQSSAA